MSAPHAVRGQTTPAVAGSSQNYVDREVNMTPWHVAASAGEDSEDSMSLIVAARSSRATACVVLQRTKMFHREYTRQRKVRLTFSRLLCAQVVWERPIHGCGELKILNVHFHHLVAKKDPPL